MEQPQQSSTARAPSPSDASSSSGSVAATNPAQQAPKDPPKIPPPPSEHPPPYTPFGGQSASLLPGAAQPAAGSQARVNRRIVHPPGFRKYFHLLTARNLLIGLAILVVLLVVAYIIHMSNKSDEELATAKALEEHHRPLEITHKGLGAIKGKRDRISFDETEDAIILSEFHPEERMLRSELIKLDDHLEGFRQEKLPLNALTGVESPQQQLTFDDCMRFTSRLVCCSTPSQGHQHLTKCFLLKSQGQNMTAVASMFDFVPRWQSLQDGNVLLLVHNRQRHAVLDLQRNILHQIEESRLPNGFISQGFHFPRETADELVELIRLGDEFRLCEYLRAHQVDQEHGNYVLKDQNCRRTPFKVEFELPRVLFCVNSLYTAVLQYGHLQGEETMLTWRIRVKFDSSETIYSTGESLHSRQEQMAMDCNDEQLELFALGDHELHQFSVKLPNLRNGHFVGNKL